MVNLKKGENNKSIKYKDIVKRNTFVFIVLFLCSSFVVGFIGGALAYNFFIGSNEKLKINNISDELNSGYINRPSMSTSQIVELVENSVVEVKIEIKSSNYNSTNGIVEGAGSGVIFSSDGYIITNYHVVEDANCIKVKVHNGSEYIASLVGEDKKEDIAVLKISATNLTPVSFGNSKNLKVGERVIVIGNPLGTLGGSVTDGIISALNRTLNIDGEDMTLLQTNAEINHGNSGGGVFGEKGQFVGLVVAKSTGADLEGLGFAIPSDTVKEVVNKLI